MADAEFTISSFCHEGGCVAVAPDSAGGVKVRSSKEADGAVLSFSREEWVAFIAGVRNGEFDVDRLSS